MIYTGSYKEFNNTKFNLYSISKDKGEDANYSGKSYLSLAPKESFFRTWKNNRGQIDEIENNKYYINEFYNQILKVLDPKKVYDELDGSILLCYEDSNEFCHRHIVAAWFELMLGVTVYEVKEENGDLLISSKPKYIKKYLECVNLT
jgi:uncharacterized protein (DUF488 family)